MRARVFFGNGDSVKKAFEDINASIHSTSTVASAAYKPVATLSEQGALRVHDDRIPNSATALNTLDEIIAKHSLVETPL